MGTRHAASVSSARIKGAAACSDEKRRRGAQARDYMQEKRSTSARLHAGEEEHKHEITCRRRGAQARDHMQEKRSARPEHRGQRERLKYNENTNSGRFTVY